MLTEQADFLSQYGMRVFCGSEQADMDDLRVHYRALQAFKREIDAQPRGENDA